MSKRPPNWHPSPLLYVLGAIVGVAAITALTAGVYRLVSNLIHANPGAQRNIGIVVGAVLGTALIATVVTALLWSEPPWIHGLAWIGISFVVGCASATSIILTRDVHLYDGLGLCFFVATAILTICTVNCWEDRSVTAWSLGWNHDAWWREVDRAEQAQAAERERERKAQQAAQREAEQAAAIKPDAVTPPSVQDIYRKVASKGAA